MQDKPKQCNRKIKIENPGYMLNVFIFQCVHSKNYCNINWMPYVLCCIMETQLRIALVLIWF